MCIRNILKEKKISYGEELKLKLEKMKQKETEYYFMLESGLFAFQKRNIKKNIIYISHDICNCYIRIIEYYKTHLLIHRNYKKEADINKILNNIEEYIISYKDYLLDKQFRHKQLKAY